MKRRRLKQVPDPPVPALARLDVLADEVVRVAQEISATVAELRVADEERGDDERPSE